MLWWKLDLCNTWYSHIDDSMHNISTQFQHTECVVASAPPSYLEHIRGPAPSSSAPFHLGFVHHRAALFQTDLVQLVVGL